VKLNYMVDHLNKSNTYNTLGACCIDLTQDSGLFFFCLNISLDASYSPFLKKKLKDKIKIFHDKKNMERN
jgi:hypothetical protein